MNRTVKRLLWKLLTDLNLTKYCAKWLLSGVIDSLNECVSSATGKSPNTSVFGVEAARLISPISVGDRVLVTDPRPIPSSAVPVRGKEGFFAGVESDSVVCVLVKTDSGKGWRPLRMHPSAVSLIKWYGLNVSSDFLNGVSESAATPADDVDRFSDFDVDEDREVDVLAARGADPEVVVSSSKSQAIFPDSVPSAAVRQLDRVVEESVSSVSAPIPFPPPFAAGSQLQAGHLELRSQQQGVGGREEKEKQSGQGREPVQAAQPAEKEEEGEVVLPDILDDDSLFSLNLLGESGGAAAFASFLAREGEQQGSRETEGVQEAQDDKKVQGAQEGKRVQGAQDDSKEGERKKVKREGNGFRKAPQRLVVDKKVVDQMMKHVKTRKGHIDAKEEEVEKGLFDEAMRGELKSFEENK
eukprot:Cvel_11247.t1-p1 / transcript=Cvel_11247.t1 / gene=Cvel_11247 / organism=Chromera_velia_CCMP2878 / gene_product=hypothetical protein / transcript_product=hypothetical protein / location=Cvel_scaffold700:70782-72016(+) / protein_length=411 / sequence_SO=supercontig / SO=protein_coding / is_pseudo=false